MVSRPDGAQIYSTSSGPEEAATLLILDGIGCAGWAFRRIVPRLAGRFRVIQTHYRGHGRSPVPPRPWRVSMPHLADDAAAILEAHAVTEVTLVGFSMGFQIALEIFRRHRAYVSSLVSLAGPAGRVLVSFQGSRAFGHALPLARAVARFAGDLTHDLWTRMLPSELSHFIGMRTQVNAERVEAEDLRFYMHQVSEMNPELFLHMLDEANRHTAEDMLPEVNVPALVMAGRGDKFVSLATLRDMAFAMPSAQWEVFPGGTHALPAEYPDEVVEQLERFMDEMAGARPDL